MAPRKDIYQLSGTVLDNRFRVDKLVAEGGFAVVYRASHVSLDRPTALKVLKAPKHLTKEEEQKAFVESFEREAKLIAKLNHPNIVQVMDYGCSRMPNGELCPWMALEWIEGQTLRADLTSRRRMRGRSLFEAWQLMKPLLDALAHAHDHGVVHRDLKPSNIMFQEQKRGRILKLLDFGISKEVQSDFDVGSGDTHTHASMQAFSLQYAAPEQLGGTKTGTWTDVHAIALILVEILTDQTPYAGEDSTSIMSSILNSTRPTPRTKNIDVGDALENVLAKAMALKPQERYRTAADFLHALEQVMGAATPIAIAPPPTPNFETAPSPAEISGPRTGPHFLETASPQEVDANPTTNGTIRSQPKNNRVWTWLAVVGGLLLLSATAVIVMHLAPHEKDIEKSEKKTTASKKQVDDEDDVQKNDDKKSRESDNVKSEPSKEPSELLEDVKSVTKPSDVKSAEPKKDKEPLPKEPPPKEPKEPVKPFASVKPVKPTTTTSVVKPVVNSKPDIEVQ